MFFINWFTFKCSTQTRTIYCCLNGNTFNFYNDDYSFYKSTTITPPYGYKIYTYCNISNKLFNLDNNIEFTCTFIDTLNYSGSLLKLFNENGNELKNFGNSDFSFMHQTLNKKLRFYVVHYTNYPYGCVTDIYSLPGIPNNQAENIFSDNLFAYPNPTKDNIFIKYKIDKSEITDLNIFNSNGVLIESKKIGGNFQQIKINVDRYKPGVYIYRYNNVNGKFIVE
jgi:hypothetical protein